MNPERDLIGTWSLVSFEIRYDDGTSEEPYGPHPFGFVHYAPDGLMLVHVSNTARPLPPAAPAGATGRSLPDYICYAGRYRIDGDRVVHDVTVSAVPAIPAGTQVVRQAVIEGSQLIITVPDALAHKPGLARLVWDRTPATGGAGAA